MLDPVYLDTSAIIEFLRGNEKIKEILENVLDIFTGVIQIYELFLGEFYLEEKGYKSRREELERFLLGLKILEFEDKDAILASKIMAKLKANGEVINDFDVLIAAQAIRRNLILVTKDRDFERLEGFGLKLILL